MSRVEKLYRKVKIGSFLKRVKRSIDIEDEKFYKRITIKTKNQGVVLRDNEKGSLIGTKKQFLASEGEFILSKIDARFGAFGIVPRELDDAIITGNFWVYEVNKDLMNIELFSLFTSSQNFIDICSQASSGTTHRKYLDEQKFLNFEILLPEINEQNSILSLFQKKNLILKEFKSEISAQEDFVKKLRQSILQEAIEGKLTAKWREENPAVEPASVLLEKIKAEKEKLITDGKIKKEKPLPQIKADEIPFDIPESWSWCRLGDVCSKIGSGSTPSGSNYTDNGIPFFRSQNIHNIGLNFDDIKFISDSTHIKMKGTIVYPNDILLNITGGSIGRCALVSADFAEGNVSQHVCIVRVIMCSYKFQHILLLSPYVQKLITMSTTGAGREGLPKYNLEVFLLPLPPLEEQKAIVEKIENLFAMCDEIEEQIKASKSNTETLMKSILKEAFE